jgi:hypothetical protein
MFVIIMAYFVFSPWIGTGLLMAGRTIAGLAVLASSLVFWTIWLAN